MLASPKPPPRNKVASEHPKPTPRVKPVVVDNPIPQARKPVRHTKEDPQLMDIQDNESVTNQELTTKINNNNNNNQAAAISTTNEALMEQMEMEMDENQIINSVNSALIEVYKSSDTLVLDNDNDLDIANEKTAVSCNSSDISEDRKPPEIIAVIPKKSESLTSLSSHNSSFDTFGRKRGFNIGTSLLSMNDNSEENHSVSSQQENADNLSVNSKDSYAISNPMDDFEINDLNIEIFNASFSKGSKNAKKILHELHGIHDLDSEYEMKKIRSVSSLRSCESMPSFLEQSNIKKWKNIQELDHISIGSDTTSFGPSRWVVGDTSDTGTFFLLIFLFIFLFHLLVKR